MVIYTNWFIPKRFAAYTIGVLILIRPKYKNDKGLLEHEKVHVRQFLHLKKSWGLTAEVEAYREQLKYYEDDRSWLFARHLASLYGFSITMEEAHEELTHG